MVSVGTRGRVGMLLFALLLLIAPSGHARGDLTRKTGAAQSAWNGPPLLEVSGSHLPRSALTGPSMDVEPLDLDDDGDLDLLVATEFGLNRLLINDGDGRFSDASRARFPSSRRDSEDIAIADFNGDGLTDLVFVSEDDEINEYWIGRSDSAFSPAPPDWLSATGRSNAVLTHDFDADGDMDLLIGNAGSGNPANGEQNRLLFNDGAGRFEDVTSKRLPSIADATQDLELGDIDGDGDLDLVVGNEDGTRILIDQGGAMFEDGTEGRLPARLDEETREADLADVDGDGDLDLLLANVAFRARRDAHNRLLINDGNGVFADESAMRLPDQVENSVDGDLVDLDDDGDLDILLANAFVGSSRIWANDGSGSFTDVTIEALGSLVAGSGIDMEAADFNGDGRLDLYIAQYRTDDVSLADRLFLAAPGDPTATAAATARPDPTETVVPTVVPERGAVALPWLGKP